MKSETIKNIAGIIVIYAMLVFGIILVNARIEVQENIQKISIEQ